MLKDLLKFYRKHEISIMIGALILCAHWTIKSFEAVFEAYTTRHFSWTGYVIVTAAVVIGFFALNKALRVKSRVDAHDPVRRIVAIITRPSRQKRRHRLAGVGS